ncbi:amylo-alpha-1,6-glucosidase [Microlunatus elymi]|uniref:Amylo-alpha-1,6-glucosidase n=1 Tax=Microlunatus elymi TaxID=2596828 RepID=A0A516Q1H0_9ACTN|nr:glycogen debranching N-terminal domain-containing protein [Microlunatus elymi]QDP97248.1 amylo-alpha-1,6-glucosidase [Microlunatus elymi]
MSTRQPLLHDSVILLRAPSQLWSGSDGDLSEQPIHGLYHGDVRFLRRLSLRVDGERPESIAQAAEDASTGVFVGIVRRDADHGADPRLRVERRRSVAAGRLSERVLLINGHGDRIRTTVEISLVADFSPMALIKQGQSADADLSVTGDGSEVIIVSGDCRARLTAADAELTVDGPKLIMNWPVDLAPDQTRRLDWSMELSDARAVVGAADGVAPWTGVEARTDDSRLRHWVRTALNDLDALRMTTEAVPGEEFFAAGAPWFFTLFGRDSIWAARMLLGLTTSMAESTLRILAAHQGTDEVIETAEQPGKIMHELRSGQLELGGGLYLPPLYYGTIDATPLWIVLLHEAWRHGLADDHVRELLPGLEAALGWLRDHGDADGDGFLEYVDRSGHGLANQGWKDSGDSIQWRDGRLAEGPIALCEVQGYAYQAAIGGAELLDHFGRDGSSWRDWAAGLKERFAAEFWIQDPDGDYPAVALDAAKRPVDSVTSNIGHLLGTGILQPGQAELIAHRLAGPELNSGYGLRTLSTDSAGYWPLSYHGGSVWAHDTAIVINGLIAEGFRAEARLLGEGLLRAAEAFGYRMPELHSGDPATVINKPVPYPAACRPQAWSAAAAIVVASAFDVELQETS